MNIRIAEFVKYISIAIRKTYNCDGVSLWQHNEPAGDQDLWHFHVHVFPRYSGDGLYVQYGKRELSNPKDREKYAKLLVSYVEENKYNSKRN